MYAEVTTNPEADFYNDEGGKNARLMVGFVIRDVPQGTTAEMVKNRLSFAIFFDDGTEVIFSSIELRRKRKQDPALTLSYEVFPNFGGYASFRVEELISKDVHSQRFRLGIKIDGGDPCLTTSFDIKTKRKYVSFDERKPEAIQRAAVNDKIKQNARTIGDMLRSTAYSNCRSPVKILFPHLTNLENEFPHMPIRYPNSQTPTTPTRARRPTRTTSSSSFRRTSSSSSSSSSTTTTARRNTYCRKRSVVVKREVDEVQEEDELDLEGPDSDEEIDFSSPPPTKKRRVTQDINDHRDGEVDDPRFPEIIHEYAPPQTPTPNHHQQEQQHNLQFGGPILHDIPEDNAMILPLALREQERGNSLPLFSNGEELRRSQTLLSSGEEADTMAYTMISNGEEATHPPFDLMEYAMACPDRDFFVYLGNQACNFGREADPMQGIDINHIFDEPDWVLFSISEEQ